MKKERFVATFAFSGEIDGALVVGAADAQRNTSRYILFQLALDEEDSEFGTIHLERDDQRWSCYDGIKRCVLDGDRLIVELNDMGVSELECDLVEVDLVLDTELLSELRSGLIRVFHRFPGIFDTER